MKTPKPSLAGNDRPVGIEPAHARLIQARAKVMDRDIEAGERLCAYSFAESDEVSTVAAGRRHIHYNPAYVLQTTIPDLITVLRAIGERPDDQGSAACANR